MYFTINIAFYEHVKSLILQSNDTEILLKLTLTEWTFPLALQATEHSLLTGTGTQQDTLQILTNNMKKELQNRTNKVPSTSNTEWDEAQADLEFLNKWPTKIFLFLSGIYLFLSCNNYYVPLKLRSTPGLSHMFILNKQIHAQNVTIQKQFLWDILHIDWVDIVNKLNNVTVMLPHEITILLLDKIRV
jgi:hypothetical protein